MKITTTIDPETLRFLLNGPGSGLQVHYRGNVYAVLSTGAHRDGFEVHTRRDGRMVYRFTLETRDAWAYGSRTAGSGRHMRKASWQAHRDAMRLIYSVDRDAVLLAGRVTYKGLRDFDEKFPATADWNVGSQMHPVRIEDTAV